MMKKTQQTVHVVKARLLKMRKVSTAFAIGLVTASTLTTVHANEPQANQPPKLPPAQLGISPPQIDQNLVLKSSTGGKSVLNKSIVLYNYNPSPKKVTLTFFDTNADFQAIEPNKGTLAPWAIINPMTFTIPGNGQQTIRMSIRPPQGFPTKTHQAVLLISQLVEKPVKEKDGSVIVSFGSSYAMPVKVTVNSAKQSADTLTTQPSAK